MLSGCMSRSTRVIVLAGAFALAGCKDGIPIVLSSSSVASPDARWEATLDEVDNGLGFGQGRAFYELHLQEHGAKVVRRCEESVSCVFYVEETANNGKPTTEWTAPRRLTVKYRTSTTPIRQVPRYMDVQIDYRPIEAAQAG
jgi:hypothetical protein